MGDLKGEDGNGLFVFTANPISEEDDPRNIVEIGVCCQRTRTHAFLTAEIVPCQRRRGKHFIQLLKGVKLAQCDCASNCEAVPLNQEVEDEEVEDEYLTQGRYPMVEIPSLYITIALNRVRYLPDFKQT